MFVHLPRLVMHSLSDLTLSLCKFTLLILHSLQTIGDGYLVAAGVNPPCQLDGAYVAVVVHLHICFLFSARADMHMICNIDSDIYHSCIHPTGYVYGYWLQHTGLSISMQTTLLMRCPYLSAGF